MKYFCILHEIYIEVKLKTIELMPNLSIIFHWIEKVRNFTYLGNEIEEMSSEVMKKWKNSFIKQSK